MPTNASTNRPRPRRLQVVDEFLHTPTIGLVNLNLIPAPANAPVVFYVGSDGQLTTAIAAGGAFFTAKMKVGLWTPTHIRYFQEGIRVNGTIVDDNIFHDCVRCIQKQGIDTVSYSRTQRNVVCAQKVFETEKTDVNLFSSDINSASEIVNLIRPQVIVLTRVNTNDVESLKFFLEQLEFNPPQSILISQNQEANIKVLLHVWCEKNNITLQMFAPQKSSRLPWFIYLGAASSQYVSSLLGLNKPKELPHNLYVPGEFDLVEPKGRISVIGHEREAAKKLASYRRAHGFLPEQAYVARSLSNNNPPIVKILREVGITTTIVSSYGQTQEVIKIKPLYWIGFCDVELWQWLHQIYNQLPKNWW